MASTDGHDEALLLEAEAATPVATEAPPAPILENREENCKDKCKNIFGSLLMCCFILLIVWYAIFCKPDVVWLGASWASPASLRRAGLDEIAEAARRDSGAEWHYLSDTNEMRLLLNGTAQQGYAAFRGSIKWDPFCGSVALFDADGTRLGRLNSNYTGYYFAIRGNLLANRKDLPAACQMVLNTDVATETTAQKCAAWCAEEPFASIDGQIPIISACEVVDGVAGDVWKACGKSRAALLSAWMRPWWAQSLVMAVYAAAGCFLAWRRSLHAEATQEEEVATPPSQNETHFESNDMPLCCVPIKSDAQRAKLQLLVAAPGTLGDNPLDMLTWMSFSLRGQPVYSIASCTSLLPVLWKDPFQSRAYAAFHRSWQQGFPAKELLEHQAHEGGIEAPFGGGIATMAFVLSDPHELSGFTLILRLASIGSAFVLAMPGAARAAALLEQAKEEPGILLSYERMEKFKKSISKTRQYAAAMSAFGSWAVSGALCMYPDTGGKICAFLLMLGWLIQIVSLALLGKGSRCCKWLVKLVWTLLQAVQLLVTFVIVISTCSRDGPLSEKMSLVTAYAADVLAPEADASQEEGGLSAEALPAAVAAAQLFAVAGGLVAYVVGSFLFLVS